MEHKWIVVVEVGTNLDELVGALPATAEVDIFSLTSDAQFLGRLDVLIRRNQRRKVTFVNSARCVDAEVERLGPNLCRWIAQLGISRVGSCNLRSFLMLPEIPISGWWLGLLAEKNPLKTDIYLRISQVSAIGRLLARRQYDGGVIAIGEPLVRKAVADTLTACGVPVAIVAVEKPIDIKERFKLALRGAGLLGEATGAMLVWLRHCWKVWIARHLMGKLEPRLKTARDLLFVTYFPALDLEMASNGVFRNKYALPLQDLLAEKNIPISWLLIYTSLYGSDFRSAVRLARGFADRGESMIVIEELFCAKDCLRALSIWFRLGRLTNRALHEIDDPMFSSAPIPPETRPLLRYLWGTSFWGAAAMHSAVYVLAFQKLFAKLPDSVNSCLYFCEMQAWEKALVAARNGLRPSLRTIGFLHSSMPRHFWPYCLQPEETERTGTPADLPLPDIVAAGGKLMADCLIRYSYSNVVEVESVRYLYLNRLYGESQKRIPRQPTLLVAGSIDKAESVALLDLVFGAESIPKGLRVLLKGHPGLPFGMLLRELGVRGIPESFTLLDDDLYGALAKSTAVLVSASTVAMEAAALGCKVICPLFPNSIQMNPLADFDGQCTFVSSSNELATVLHEVMEASAQTVTTSGWNLVNSYWNLDVHLPAWKALLANTMASRPALSD